MLASHNNPAASAVATDTAAIDVIAAVGFPWVPAVVTVCCRSTVDVPGAPAVAKISGVAAVTTAVDGLPAAGVSNVSSVPAVLVVSCVAVGPAVLLTDVFPSLESRQWLESAILLPSLLLLRSLLLPVFQRYWRSLLLLASQQLLASLLCRGAIFAAQKRIAITWKPK